MTPDELRYSAHQAMSLLPSPWLRYHNGRHAVRDGVGLNAQDPPGPSFNYAAVLGVDRSLDHVVRLADEFFAGREGSYGILVEGDAGCSLEAELRSRGWAVFEDEPALVRPTLSDIAPDSGTHPELMIRMVSGESELSDFGNVLGIAFQSPPELMSTLKPTTRYASDPDVAVFVGYRNGRAVAAGQVFRMDRYAVVAGIGTVPELRGRGYGAALTHAALLEGRRRGCVTGALRSGPLSMPLYQRLGFQIACKHRTYVPPESRRE